VKLLVGVLLLIAAFAAAAIWQWNWRAEAEARRELARTSDDRSSPRSNVAAEEGWGRVIIGRPSGADPVAPSSEPLARADTSASPLDAQTPATRPASTPQQPTDTASGDSPAAPAGEARVVVQHGESLSSLCQTHYGTRRLELVQALAAYNHLKDPDRVREGQVVVMPPIERLIVKNR
jgi:nucleoid-associated protein YgaU